MTAQDSSQPTDRQRPRFQYTLRGLMVLFLGVAVGLGWARMRGPNGEAILAAATVWIVLGLAAQVRDLWRTFHGRTGLTRDQRWGWRFAVFWRLGIACLLIGYYGVTLLAHHALIELPDHEESLLPEGVQLREGLLYLSLVIALSSTPRLTARRKPRRFSCMLDVVAVIGCALLCLLIVVDRMMLTFLVHVACNAIDFAQPLRYSSPDVYSKARGRELLGWSFLAAAFFLVVPAVLCRFTREWRRSRKSRVIWTCLLLFSLMLAGVYPICM